MRFFQQGTVVAKNNDVFLNKKKGLAIVISYASAVAKIGDA